MTTDRPGSLVLRRAPGEAIAIGQDVIVHVVEVTGGKAVLMVQAPKSMPVWRTELLGTKPKGVPGETD